MGNKDSDETQFQCRVDGIVEGQDRDESDLLLNSDHANVSRPPSHHASAENVFEEQFTSPVEDAEQAAEDSTGQDQLDHNSPLSNDDGGHDMAKNSGTENEDMQRLQDHGWAWVVCFGGFLSHVIIGGFERSDGVLFLEFTDKFNQGAQVTAWPASICSTIRLLMGPVATAVCNRFSARAATMAGALLFAAGLLISSLAPSIVVLFFFYGILQGIGRGLVYAPGLIIVGMYFNRRRGLGVGLATAGVGAGTFAFPPLVEWLFEEFGFRGAFIVMGAIAFNSCVVGALYRPLFIHRNIVLGHRKRSTDEEEALCLTRKHINSEKPVSEDLKVDTINDSMSLSKPSDVAEKTTQTVGNSHKSEKSRSKYFQCLKAVFSVCFPVELQKKNAPKRKLIEWTLLKNPAFLFYCFSICLFTLSFKSAFTFLPALAQSKGVAASDSAYLLSISGILDTFGRIMAGFVLDANCIRAYRPVVYNSVVFFITGLSFLSPFMESFLQFAVLFGLYGMLTGTYVSQKSVLLVDILGLEKLSSSFGLMIFFQGLGTLVGPPLSGLLKDVFGRFNEVFYLGGAAMALAGILMIVSNVFRITRIRRDHKEANADCAPVTS